MYPEGSAMEVILVVAVAHSEYSMLTNGEEDVKTNADRRLRRPIRKGWLNLPKETTKFAGRRS
jgi:hypothetical protein